MKQQIKTVKQLVKQAKQNGGATVTLAGGGFIEVIPDASEAFQSVSGFERTYPDLTTDNVSEFIRHVLLTSNEHYGLLRGGSVYLGIWHDKDLWYLDLSVKRPLLDAVAFGILNGELAVYSPKYGAIKLPQGQRIGTYTQRKAVAYDYALEIVGRLSI